MHATKPPTAGGTRADRVFAALRDDILTGHLLPGAKLAFADLQSRYSVSTGVLREVLPRLVEQGLATTEPQLGYRVVTVSVDDLNELTEARVELEALVTQLAVTEGDVDYEAAVLGAHHALARTPQLDEHGDLNSEWIARHEAFHHAVLAGCGNRYLLAAAERLRTISALYRYWTIGETVRIHRDIDAEHLAICEAAVARDAEQCASLVAEHIRLTTDIMLASQAATTADPDGSAA